MSINRFSVHIGTKGKASPHFAYITATGKYENKMGVGWCDSGNMPKWARDDPSKFWAAADEHERANGQTYKEHIISIPRELPEHQRTKFVRTWIRRELGSKHPYTYAMHCTKASDGKENPHAHIMFSTRTLDEFDRTPEQFFKRYNAKDPAKGGAKKAETGLSRGEMKNNLEQQRERWDDMNKEFALQWGYDPEPRHDPTKPPTPNKSMAEIQKAQKLDTMLENHPWYISPEPVPKFVPAPPAPTPTPTPVVHHAPTITPQIIDDFARSFAEELSIDEPESFAIDKRVEPLPTPEPRPQTPPQREKTGYDYDFGM